MPRAPTTTLTVRLSGALRDFVAESVGEDGDYENVSEYADRYIQGLFEAVVTMLKVGASAPALGVRQVLRTTVAISAITLVATPLNPVLQYSLIGFRAIFQRCMEIQDIK